VIKEIILMYALASDFCPEPTPTTEQHWTDSRIARTLPECQEISQEFKTNFRKQQTNPRRWSFGGKPIRDYTLMKVRIVQYVVDPKVIKPVLICAVYADYSFYYE
jgi:hypothetical protein